jgi:hypothetical protein
MTFKSSQKEIYQISEKKESTYLEDKKQEYLLPEPYILMQIFIY